MTDQTNKQKLIKSFVLRQGKITLGQQNAINKLMPNYGIPYTNARIDLNNVFGRDNPKIIEIGFGMGNATWKIAKESPDFDYLGIEVHSPGVGSLLMAINEHQISNVKIINHDAVEVLKNMIPNNSIYGFHIFFPDPWPKKRHHKRRLIQPELIKLLTEKLTKNGYIHLATDWEDYAHSMLNVLNQIPNVKNTSTTNSFVQRPSYRPITKFETRGINLGHNVWDLIFVKD